MTPKEKKEITKLIKEVLIKELPRIFSRSLVQVKDYFIKNII